jgi:hypothetical protein
LTTLCPTETSRDAVIVIGGMMPREEGFVRDERASVRKVRD